MTDIMSFGPPGSRENEIGPSRDLLISKKLKRLTAIFFYQKCVGFVFSTMNFALALFQFIMALLLNMHSSREMQSHRQHLRHIYRRFINFTFAITFIKVF